MAHRPIFIGSKIYRRSTYGGNHPFAIPRVSAALDLMRALGWVAEERYIEAPRATPDELARFHHRDYIAAVMCSEEAGRVDPAASVRFNIGRNGNPFFADIFSRPATACGATLRAIELLLAPDGPPVVYSPAGGTHHGRADQAAGFCYFNDPVLGILRLLDRGIGRVLYIDLDAHHADGVQDALAGDGRVLVTSVHEQGRWPYTGAAEDRGGGNVRNLPVPAEFNDSELDFLVAAALLPLGRAFAPEMLIIQCSADALAEDPLSRIGLSNSALWRAVASLQGLAPRVLVFGGGGYNPWSVARCWAGVWATLNGFAVPEQLSFAAEAVLRGLSWSRSAGRNPPEHWFTTLADPPRPGPVRPKVRRVADQTLAGLEPAPQSRSQPASLPCPSFAAPF